MAIRLVDVKLNGKRVQNMTQLKVAKRIDNFIKRANGIDARIEINRNYADNWYSLDEIEKMIKEEKVERTQWNKEYKERWG